MRELVNSFTTQLKESNAIGSAAELTVHKSEIHNVLISGLGGSGIGGTIIQDISKSIANCPISINKTYEIPAFVNENTLVIISSYSGNTEETLEAMHQAINAKAKVCCITSGGTVQSIAKEKGLDCILVPGDNQPRAMLAYSVTALMYTLSFHQVIPETFKQDWAKSIELIDANEAAIQKEAYSVAEKLNGKTPILYGMDGYEGVTVRFRQQLNENAKILLWHHIIPEMNHNELVGWTQADDNQQVVFMSNKTDSERISKRTNICLEIIGKYSKEPIVLNSIGENQIQNTLYWIHFGDWVSCYLSEIRQVDPVEVRVIDYLKSELAK